jgi:glycosyltransferase involved in cell wall biosynthesis
VADSFRIVQLNLAYDGTLTDPEALLHRYHTLTGWARAVAQAGAVVHVVQRFSASSQLSVDDVVFQFVQEGSAGAPDPWAVFAMVVAAVRAAAPAVVHINGLMFPGMVSAVRSALPPNAAIVLQDHSGSVPRPALWPLRQWSVSRWQQAFAAADACSFTAAELAAPWRSIGLGNDQRVLEIPEASAALSFASDATSRRDLEMRSAPAILWVGRLDANKDPLTVLAGLEIALPRLAQARCWMIYGEGRLEDDVRRRIGRSPVLRDRVVLVGPVPHDEMWRYYRASDVFVSGSHHEGSGYALIEAMACGVTPCVTDIPAFRALTGDCGVRWPAGDANGCAAALVEAARGDRAERRARVHRRFDTALSWDVIGRRTVAEYRSLAASRRQTDRW